MPANEAEAAAWNGARGDDWVRLQAVLDDLMIEPLELAITAAALTPGEAVLDIGCGAGATSLAAGRAVERGGRVLGADVSAPMLRHAAGRAEAEGLSHVSFTEADAQVHAFEPGTFDAAISRFGVMFFDDSTAAFRNIAAALKPGGRITFVTWAGPDTNPWFTLPAQAGAEVLGPSEPTDPDAPGPMAFRDIERVTGMMAAGGLENCAGMAADIQLHPGGTLDEVLRLAMSIGPISRMLTAKNGTEADRDAIAAVLRDRLAQYDQAGEVKVPGRVNVYTARKPA